MKKTYFNPAYMGRSSAAKITSRRMPGANLFGSSAYKSDGEPNDEAKQLLEKINGQVSSLLNERAYQNKDAVQALINDALKGLNLDALRNFDIAKTEDTVKNLAAAYEKIKNAPGAEQTQVRSAIQALLSSEETWKIIERAFDKNSQTTVTLNLRAALPVMGLTNVVNDGDIPEDILNSYSVEAFIKKRRPNEFIFDIVTRRTVGEVTEYKTWLEEGDEEGAFALVAEGAVKPLVSKTLVRNTSKYKKIAGKRVYTEEFAKFRREAYRILEDLFNDQLLRNYAALLVIDLDAKAAAYTGTILDGQYTNPTDYHAIGAVAAQIESLNFYPDVLIINPQDKWRIALQQNLQGSFFLPIPMYNPDGTVTMLGFRVITSNNVPVGYAYLGEGGLYKVEDETVSVRLGYGINVTKDSNGFVTDVTSDVDTNRFRIISEFYYHSWIGTNHLGSYVKFNFADVKEALTTP